LSAPCTSAGMDKANMIAASVAEIVRLNIVLPP
jgi:hypothetical protein